MKKQMAYTLDMRKIEALAEATRQLDAQYAAIVDLQHTAGEIQPAIVGVMLEYMQLLRAHQSNVGRLDGGEFAALKAALGGSDE